MRRIRRLILGTLLVSIASYAIWGWVESARLSRAIAQIKQRGEPIEMPDWQTPLRTAEQRDAASSYAKGAELAQEKAREDGYRFGRVDVERQAAAAELTELEATYRRDDPALQWLDHATPLDFAGFGTIAPQFFENQEPLGTLGALNDLRADILARRGDGDAAAGALVASVRLQRTISIPFYRYQSGVRLLGSLRILLRHTSPREPSLLALQRAFEELPDEDGLPRDMMQRRTRFLESVNGPRRVSGEAILLAALRPIVTFFVRRQLASFDDAIAVARQPWPVKLEATAALRRRYPEPAQRRNRSTLRNLIEYGPPGLGAAFFFPETAGLDLATRRVAITVLALERYRRAHAGAPAPALDALVPAFMAAVPQDPFSGTPVVYKKEADSYLVYSVDIDRIDDGGVLYGVGAMATAGPRGPKPPRDVGIRVPLLPVTNQKERR